MAHPPDGVPPESPDFYHAYVATLEARATELAGLAERIHAVTEVEVSNPYARMRLNGAQIVALEFTDAAVSAAKSALAQQVMNLYLDGQAELARRNASGLASLGIDLMGAMPAAVAERAAEQEQA